MKAPAPPPPKVSQENRQPVKQEKVLSRYNAIVYVHEDKNWKPLYDKYTPLICSDYGGEELNERYCLSTFVGQERVLQYYITSSTKVKIKESFVRCQNDKLIVGARFKTDDVAQNYHQQLLGILSEISPYAKVNKNLRKGSETLERQHSKDQKQNLVIQTNEETAAVVAPKKETVPVGNGISNSAPNTYDARRESASNTNAAKKDSASINDIRRGSASNAVKKDTSNINDVRRGPASNNNTVKKDTTSNINDIRRGSASKANVVKKDTTSNINDNRTDSFSSNSTARRDSSSVNNVRRESASSTSTARRDSANVDNVRRESASNNGSVAKRDPSNYVAPKRDSISTGVQKRVAISTSEDKQAQLSNTDDPIWRVFLGLANLQSTELSNPRIASIVKNFVLERGGDTFLRQVNDQKVSARLVDDLNSLAGQVHAITEQPAPKPLVKPERPPAAVRQTSQSTMPLEHETATLDRRTKNKRRAPPPPVRSKSLQNLVDDEGVDKTDRVEFDRTTSVSGKPPITSPAGKRKAPAVPAKKSPPLAAAFRKHVSEFPHFVAPPPPSGPPPDESIGSPVGPLSPESAGMPAREVSRHDTDKADLTEEHNALAQLDMVICAEENSDDMVNDDVFSAEDPGTPIVKRNGNLPIVGKTILGEDESSSAEVKMEPLNIETQGTKKSETGVDTSVPSPQQNGNANEENLVQLQMQQQLLALQEQVKQQEQMMLAAGLLKKKENVGDQDKPVPPAVQPEPNPPDTVKTKIEVSQSTSKPLKQNAVIVPPEKPPHTQQNIKETKEAEVITKPPLVPVEPVHSAPIAIEKETTDAINVVVDDMQPIDEGFIDLDLPPPPPELLEDTIIASPIPSPICKADEERYERIIGVLPKESTPIHPSKKANINVTGTSDVPIANGEIHTPKVVIEPQPTAKVSTPPPLVTPSKMLPVVSPTTPVTPTTTTEPQTAVKSSTPSPDASTKLPVGPPAQPGLPKKPMSGLYAKLKARTAAKGGKMPISTTGSTTKPPQIPNTAASLPPKVNTPVKPKVEQPGTQMDMQKGTKGPVPPVGLGSIIGSEPVTVMRRDQLKISDPSTKVRREPLKISEPISSAREPEPPMLNNPPKNDESAIKGPMPVGIIAHNSNEPETKIIDKPEKIDNIHPETNVNVEPLGTSDVNIVSIAEPEPIAVSTNIVELKTEAPSETVSDVKSSDVLCSTKSSDEIDKVENNTDVEELVVATIEVAAVESEPIDSTSNIAELEVIKCTLEAAPVPNEPDQNGAKPDELVQNNDVVDSAVINPVSSCVSIETNDSVKEKPAISLMPNDITKIENTSPPNNHTTNNAVPQYKIQKTVYTNSQLNEVQSKGYHRIAPPVQNANVTEPKALVNGTENVIGTSEETVGSIEGDTSSKATVSNITEEHSVKDNVTENTETTSVNESSEPVIDKDVTTIITNGDSPVTYFYGEHSNGINGVASNGDDGQHTNGNTSVSNPPETVPPPKKVAKNPPPAPKPKPLSKSNSLESAETTPVVNQSSESAKDRMIRNIQERGTPYDERGLVNQTHKTLPSQQANANRNTNNKIIEPSASNKGVEVLDKSSPLFEDVRGTNNREPNKPPPTVKPKPKPKTIPYNNNNIVNENKPATYMRNVSEEPGSRQTTNMKTVGSLNIGFARDSSREIPRTADSATRGTLPRKEPPKTLPKTKIYRSGSTDSTSSNDSSVKSSELANGPKLSMQNSIDVDLRSTSARNESQR